MLQECSGNTGSGLINTDKFFRNKKTKVSLQLQRQWNLGWLLWPDLLSFSHVGHASPLSRIFVSDRGLSPEPKLVSGCLYNPVPGEETGSDGGKLMLVLLFHVNYMYVHLARGQRHKEHRLSPHLLTAVCSVTHFALTFCWMVQFSPENFLFTA